MHFNTSHQSIFACVFYIAIVFLFAFQELEVEKAAKKQRKQAVATFYNMNKLATKQNVWAKLIQENKQKEKDKESPLQRVIRMRKNINKWKKVGLTHHVHKKSWAHAEYFQTYATETRSATSIAQNVLYFFRKWSDIARSSSRNVNAVSTLPKENPLESSTLIAGPVENLPAAITPLKQAKKKSIGDTEVTSRTNAIVGKMGQSDGRRSRTSSVASQRAGKAPRKPSEGPARDTNYNRGGVPPGASQGGGSAGEETRRDTNIHRDRSPAGAQWGPERRSLHVGGNILEITEDLDNCSEVLDEDGCIQERSQGRRGGDLAWNNSSELRHRQPSGSKNEIGDEKSYSASDLNVSAAESDGMESSSSSVDPSLMRSRSQQMGVRAPFVNQEQLTVPLPIYDKEVSHDQARAFAVLF